MSIFLLIFYLKYCFSIFKMVFRYRPSFLHLNYSFNYLFTSIFFFIVLLLHILITPPNFLLRLLRSTRNYFLFVSTFYSMNEEYLFSAHLLGGRPGDRFHLGHWYLHLLDSFIHFTIPSMHFSFYLSVNFISTVLALYLVLFRSEAYMKTTQLFSVWFPFFAQWYFSFFSILNLHPSSSHSHFSYIHLLSHPRFFVISRFLSFLNLFRIPAS